jgi:hypothetical protein
VQDYLSLATVKKAGSIYWTGFFDIYAQKMRPDARAHKLVEICILLKGLRNGF